ncbi:MAG: hypothetical protein ACN4GW_04285 [Desulforhopalus sp.]
MNSQQQQGWDGVERRNPNNQRRISDRRSYRERRSDTRGNSQKPRRRLSAWFRSLIRARLGVDRRKNIDRRVLPDRRHQKTPSSLLTKDELADLLK